MRSGQGDEPFAQFPDLTWQKPSEAPRRASVNVAELPRSQATIFACAGGLIAMFENRRLQKSASNLKTAHKIRSGIRTKAERPAEFAKSQLVFEAVSH